ncbi:hypothetical protein DPMN_041298 [Dreissena polymorpha]|uniref:Secreted protein n=1 Tax=Dreissena polymorpha TaxID=45954 RepID=A0A9D4CWN5_DREPO|nr:hypothetical protein DPMN_041298 [Dreissena polymorpha]
MFLLVLGGVECLITVDDALVTAEMAFLSIVGVHDSAEAAVPVPATTADTSGTTVEISAISVESVTVPVLTTTAATSGTTVVISVISVVISVESVTVLVPSTTAATSGTTVVI